MNSKKISLLPFVLCVLFAILARATGIVYSLLATNVIYADSVIVQILPALRQVLSSVSFAVSAGAAVHMAVRRSSVKVPVTVYFAVLLADAVTVILYDGLSGELEGRFLYGILYRLGLIAYSMIILFIGIAIARAILKRGGSLAVSAATAGVLPVAVDLISVLWKSIASLIEWEFLPFASEVYTILFEVGTVLVMGVLSAIIAIKVAKTSQKEADKK